MKVIQNNDGMVGQQFLQGCSRLMKESQKNAGSFCCVFGSKINYSLTIHTDLTRLRIMIPHVWIAYKLHQFYRFQIPWNQKKKTSTLTHLPKNHKSFTCFSGVFPPPEAWTNDDTRHLRHRDVWWGGFFSTEVPFFFTSQNKVWQSKSLKARKVSWRKLPFTISKHILYIYIYILYTVHIFEVFCHLPLVKFASKTANSHCNCDSFRHGNGDAEFPGRFVARAVHGVALQKLESEHHPGSKTTP